MIISFAGAFFAPCRLARWKRIRHARESDDIFVDGEARARALGLMNEEEIEDYVERVIHEFRKEQREKNVPKATELRQGSKLLGTLT